MTFSCLRVPQVGGDQLVLEQALGLGFGYPAVVAVSGSKRRFAVQRDAFGDANTAKFVKDIVSGKQSTSAAEKWPALKTITVRSIFSATAARLADFSILIFDRPILSFSLGTEKTPPFPHPSQTSMKRPTCEGQMHICAFLLAQANFKLHVASRLHFSATVRIVVLAVNSILFVC